MKKILSYFFPVTQKIRTEFNGIVELTYYNGRKMLNSAHANYSYDSLQRLLKFGLQKIDLSKVETVLLLGLGGGSVIKTLTDDFGFKGQITAVELDKKIIEIAENEFQIFQGPHLDIIHDDAFEFTKKSKNNYDLIIIDLFIDNLVPEIFYSPDFWNNISERMENNGVFIFNAALSKSKNIGDEFFDKLNVKFRIDRYEKVEGTNSLLIGKKKLS